MKKKFTEEQIAYALKRAKYGTTVAEGKMAEDKLNMWYMLPGRVRECEFRFDFQSRKIINSF
jgi:hypothetical protein